MENNVRDLKIAIVGLGYVGLPLAVEFGKYRKVIGFDINKKRINELKNFVDITNETELSDLKTAKNLYLTSKPEDLCCANCFIITVPTPINAKKEPDLQPLISATQTVGSVLQNGDLVIYESTVFPGCTEEECVPVLENCSGLAYEKNLKTPTGKGVFYIGYSPERINPGDTKHRLSNIIKVIAGSSPRVADVVNDLYKEIIVAGTYKAESIKIAEAAKVIENTQRDLNIALVNELAIIFNKIGLDTEAVLNAAATKWNFLNFKPGLVGGHCIGVDPYYLTHKSQKEGYNPEVILAGRRINDSMGVFVACRCRRHCKKDLLTYLAREF